MKNYPKLTSEKNLHDMLEIRKNDQLLTLYIDGISVVSYTNKEGDHLGDRLDVQKEDLVGKLYFNNSFFRKFELTKSTKGKSDMENLAKTFFKVNQNNYAALVQYLHAEGQSAEHYHTLEESIVQLAGKSIVELRAVTCDTDLQIYEMNEGDILRIPSKTLHIVKTHDQGSLTVPIKETIKGKKDHLYQPKSEERIKQEIQNILEMPGFGSGNAIVGALFDYHQTLSCKQKKGEMEKFLTKIETENPNVRKIIKKLLAYIK